MPESIRDRCTKAHEYIFLLSKSRKYYFDAEAIAEQGAMRPSGQTQHKYMNGAPENQTKEGLIKIRDKVYERVNRRSVWTIATAPYSEAHFATFPPELPELCIKAGCPKYTCSQCGNVLDTYHVSKRSSTTGHMPAMRDSGNGRRQGSATPVLQQALHGSLGIEESNDDERSLHNVERLCGDLQTGSSTVVEGRLCDGTSFDNGVDAWSTSTVNGGCSPQERREGGQQTRQSGSDGDNDAQQNAEVKNGQNQMPALHSSNFTVSACPHCKADITRLGAIVPGTVLDCFGGAGTTGLVADRLQRHAILIELNPQYAEMAKARIDDDRGPLLDLMEAAQ
jgi:hypothetical protein